MTEMMTQNNFEEYFSRPSGQRKYYRDIWCLGPNGTGYPGGFPRGLMPLVLRRWNGTKKLMLFSGSFHKRGWETVDIKPETKPSFVMNAEELPNEWTEKFDLVFADPPYSKEESLKLYNLPYFNIFKLMNEMARVTKPGGHMIFLPSFPLQEVKDLFLCRVDNVNRFGKFPILLTDLVTVDEE